MRLRIGMIKGLQFLCRRFFIPWMVFLSLATAGTVYLSYKPGKENYWDFGLLLITLIISSLIIRVQPHLESRHNYFKEKPSAPYIILFMALLLSCAFLLIAKLERVAEQTANIAYFLLVIGVIIEINQYRKGVPKGKG
jgi:hypothetical protein